MKTLCGAISAAFLLCALVASSGAADYAWTPTATGSAYAWTNPANWGGSGYPNDTGDTAWLTNNIAGAQGIGLYQPVTLGALYIGDRAATYAVFTLTNAGGSITMDAASGNAMISKPVPGNTVADVIAASVILNDPLVLANHSTNSGSLTLSGTISGGQSVTKRGLGSITLSGSNTFSGGLILEEGTLVLSTWSNAPGGGPITLGAGSGGAAVTLVNGLAYGSNPTNSMPQGIRVAGGNTGVVTVGASVASGGGYFSGPLFLDNHDVTLATVGSSGNMALTLNGPLSGTGDVHLVPQGSGAQVVMAGRMAFEGTLYARGAGSGTAKTSLSGQMDPTVAKVIQDSRTTPLSMSANNTNYPNGVLVRSGQLNFGNANALGTGTVWLGDDAETNSESVHLGSGGSAAPGLPNTIVLADRARHSGEIRLGSLAGALSTFRGAVTGNHDVILSANAPSSGGATTFSGSLNCSGAVVNANVASGAFTISGEIGPNVTLLSMESPASAMTLSAANTFTGTASVKAGRLNMGHINALQGATLDTGPAGTQAVAFTVSGAKTYALGGLEGTNGLFLGANALRVGANGRDTVFAGTFSVTGAPAVSLIKVGDGQLTLARSSGIATGGGIVVSNGVLWVNGSAEGAPIAVRTGAVIGGTGTVAAASLTLSPGAGFGARVYSNGVSEALTVTGSLDLSGLALHIIGTNQLKKLSYEALRCGSHTGVFATNNLPHPWEVDYTLPDSVRIRSRAIGGAVIQLR